MTDPFDFSSRSRPPFQAGPSPEVVLGSMFAEFVRRLFKDEFSAQLATAPTPPPTPWMTPPVAARACGVPVKTIRAWVRAGRITKRLKNRSADPKQLKFLVNLDEVVAAAEDWSAASVESPGETVQDRARRILAARAGKGR
jgi:hypothetical protein